MKFLLRTAAVLIVAVILVSSFYLVFFTESEEPESLDNETNENQGNDQDNGGDDDSDDNGDSEFVHTVFIEEATSTTCKFCPNVAEILHELYNPDDPDFYYVSMVSDVGTKAYNRLYDEYNVLGLPTVYIDGGYKLVVGAKEKSRFEKDISKAVSRNVPKLYLNLYAEWDDNKSELTTTITIENKESETYNGRLKVYITEINSRWNDYNGNPYDFAFLDFAVDENIKVKADENKTYSDTWDASSSGYSDVYPENLWIIAVVFNSESTKNYSDPDDLNRDGDKNEFNAYYADAADAARVAEGNLPPAIGIGSPKKGVRYILGREGMKTLIGKTIIIGKTTIKTNVVADSGVEKVEFSIIGLLSETGGTLTDEPYEWTWDEFAFGKYTITVTVYDKEGRTATDSLEVFAFILGNLGK